MSGRPGSNRPPRPWQGRALPNELLPRMLRTKKWSAKVTIAGLQAKFICIGDCIVYSRELQHSVCRCTDVYTLYSILPKQEQQISRSGNKKENVKRKPNCVLYPCLCYQELHRVPYITFCTAKIIV